MTKITSDALIITIPESDPQERKEWLIKAIAAAIRWNANLSSGEKYTADGDNLFVLAQLLEELVEVDKSE
ncbi:MAG: hypothetical protein ABS68_00165 [Niastella sp. SCN 39-18]|nr:hypothetical protein [Sphingobacteriales bacterium]ODT55167.1 MAG: hypothetical protein ABS68_00165 [Niastella sp. SCN 39-18]OJW09121.1 MAG: hypothetical protein BGO53_00240 [Sphingobacteriales bacterium 39-19]